MLRYLIRPILRFQVRKFSRQSYEQFSKVIDFQKTIFYATYNHTGAFLAGKFSPLTNSKNEVFENKMSARLIDYGKRDLNHIFDSNIADLFKTVEQETKINFMKNFHPYEPDFCGPHHQEIFIRNKFHTLCLDLELDFFKMIELFGLFNMNVIKDYLETPHPPVYVNGKLISDGTLIPDLMRFHYQKGFLFSIKNTMQSVIPNYDLMDYFEKITKEQLGQYKADAQKVHLYTIIYPELKPYLPEIDYPMMHTNQASIPLMANIYLPDLIRRLRKNFPATKLSVNSPESEIYRVSNC